MWMTKEIYIVLMSLEFLVTLILIGIILLQQSKSGGGLGFMSGGTTEVFLGTNAGNILTKSTWILMTVFLVLSLFLAWGAVKVSTNTRSAADGVVAPASTTPAPAAPASGK